MPAMEIALILLALVLAAGCVGLVLARERAVKARHAAESELAVTREKLAEAANRLPDFERLRQDSLQAAQAAMHKTALDLSSKLLEDHKREAVAAKQASELRLKEVAQPLVDHAAKLDAAVAALNSQLQDKGKTLDTVMRALSSPGGAGAIAEVGLANTLKSFGLEEGRDYVLQFSAPGEASGQRLRPDAVVFLPDDTMLVIDCKASKAILDIAEAEGKEAEAAAYRGLAGTMNTHLKALASKDYESAVQSACRAAGRGESADIRSVMYLPSDLTLDKLCRADGEFRRKAQNLNIMPAGPGTLHALVSFAAGNIRRQRQDENQARIIETAGALLDSVRIALEFAAKAGKGIETAASSFADFARSVNKRLLRNAGKLDRLGVRAPKPLPASVPVYEVRRLEETIDGESEELDAPTPPPRPRLI